MIQFSQQQPIRFNVLDVICNCNALEYRQLVNQNDETQYQIEVAPCADAIDLVVNGTFLFSASFDPWTVGGAWSIENFTACYDPSAGTGTLEQDILSPNRYYVTELTVLEIASGGFVDVIYGTNSVKRIRTTGKHKIYGFNDDTNDNFTLSFGTARVCIDNVSVKEVDLNLRMLVQDDANTIYNERFLPDFITQFASGSGGQMYNEINGDEFHLHNQWLTVFYAWGDVLLNDGCYNFAVLDNCINSNSQNRIPNGEFEWPSEQSGALLPVYSTDQPWTITELAGSTLNVAVTTAGVAAYNGAVGGSATLEQDDLVGVGIAYDFTIDIVVGAGTGNVQLQYGTNLSSVFSTTGTHTGTVTSNGNTFKILISGDARVEINYVRHTLDDTADYFVNHDSVGFTLGNHQCTVRVNACNEVDTFDMGFAGTRFSPFIRLEAKIVRAQYEFERATFRNSNGNRRVGYYDRTKKQILRIERQPEYVHDFLSLLPGFDHWYADTIEYFVPDGSEYVVEYDDELDDLGSVDIEITEKEKLIRNVACTEDNGGCVLPPNVLLLENGSAALQEDGSFILING